MGGTGASAGNALVSGRVGDGMRLAETWCRSRRVRTSKGTEPNERTRREERPLARGGVLARGTAAGTSGATADARRSFLSLGRGLKSVERVGQTRARFAFRHRMKEKPIARPGSQKISAGVPGVERLMARRTRAKLFSRQNCAERFEKASAGPTHSRTRRRSPSSTRATLPSRLLPTARYPPQFPARSPASPRPARNAPRRLAAHEHANRRDVRRARCRLLVGDDPGRTSRGRAAARGGAMRPRVERALERRRESGRLDPNRHAPRGRRGYASFPTDAAASSNISSDASESD